jgi:hypothetical protein
MKMGRNVRRAACAAAFVGASALAFTAGRKSVRGPACSEACYNLFLARHILGGQRPVTIEVVERGEEEASTRIVLREHYFDDKGDYRRSLDDIYTIGPLQGTITRGLSAGERIAFPDSNVVARNGARGDKDLFRTMLLSFRSRLKVTCSEDPRLGEVLNLLKVATDK